MDALDRILGKIVNVLTLFTCLLMILLTVVVIFEIMSRYLFNLPITFTDELTGIFFPWIVFLTAIDVTNRDEHIAITVFSDKLTGGARKVNQLMIKAIMLMFSLFMVKSSYLLCQETANISLPVLRFITKAEVYSGIVFSFSFISLLLLLQMVKILRNKSLARENGAA